MAGNSANYPNRLKAVIKHVGLTEKEVAHETNIPLRTLSDYCAGKVPIPRRRLEEIARVIGCTPAELVPAVWEKSADQPSSAHRLVIGNDQSMPPRPETRTLPPIFNALPLSQDRIERGSICEEFSMDQLRREILHLLGTAGAIVPFSELAFGWKQAEKLLARSWQPDAHTIDSLAMVNMHLWDLYKTTTSKSLVLDGVLGQMKTLLHFLREVRATASYQKVNALTSEISQLAGEIFFDRQDHHAAATCYAFAAAAAKDAQDYELWACALARYAFLPIYNAQYQDALPYIREAGRLAQKGNRSFATRYWVAAIEAEALSGIGDLVTCQKALARAQEITHLQVSNPTWLRFEAPRLPALRGACFIRLHQPQQAIPALDEALKQQTYQVSSRRRGLVLVDQAAVALQLGEIEQACASLEEVLETLSCYPSNFLRREIYKKRMELEPFAYTPSVKQLDQHIRSIF